MTGRLIAFEVLRRVEEGGAFASRTLDAALAGAGTLDPREAGIATELTYGTLRRTLSLDDLLAGHMSRPLSDVDPAARVALRLGAYQMLHLKTPPYAAVSEAVALARTVQHGRAAGFVNAVLRSLARDPRPLEPPPLSEDPVGHISKAEALPRWLAEEWVTWLGAAEALALARAMNEPALLTLRSSRRDALIARLVAAGVRASPAPRSPEGILVRNANVAAVSRAAGPISFQVQDEGAQLVALYAAAPLRGRNARILDACAAPGGKTFQLADLLGPGGEVVAVEVHPGKAERLRLEVQRRGLASRIRVLCADASQPIEGLQAASFDAVLLDAPCSGLGTLRRHPELKLRRSAEDPPRLAQEQRALLTACARYPRPGAPLTYCVCSLTRMEGPAIVEWATGRGHARAEAPTDLPRDVLAPDGTLLTLPHRHGCDGFYAARLFPRA
ncbi:MAG TPA: transcription antitermination factor NusB [Anaeromyxobacteraceae bacterium]|nr:transcription antitermination factor NusB [Anaeromyxobacteraceae bacterium]